MDSKAVLIIAASGRALAASAQRGGYVPLVVDYFGDSDTLALAAAHALIEDGLARGMTAEALDGAIARVTVAQQPSAVVCGSGFEDRPQLLAQLARRWPLFGNHAETVAKVKDPATFASLCSALGIPHPEIALSPPNEATGWLAKRKGGAGGGHVKPARECMTPRGIYYYQREVAGAPISVLFLANGRHACIIGFSSQWSAPLPRRPFRYGGAVQPAELDQDIAQALAASVHRLAAAIPLIGLNSADFLVEGDNFRLLEINPRPSATLDLFERPEQSLFALHMSACAGKLDCEMPSLPGATAAAIRYAEYDVSIPALDWPDWVTDWPHAGAAVCQGEPLCTVHASAMTATAARRLVDERLATVLAWTHARTPWAATSA
jgi:predicted ATP-grasp superfamily ATP-dependent carboligase